VKLNFGILGPGAITDDQHAPALASLENARLWSVLSRDIERAEAFAIRHRAAAENPAFDEYDEMLADPDLDAVIIATPDRFHAAQAVAAARAGKHVLTEKPMATSIEEARSMIDACACADVRLGVAYHLRWHAGHRRVRDLILGGAIGTPRHMRVHWTFRAADGGNWRAAPETGRWWALAANGTHCLDLIRWMLMPSAGEIAEVSGLFSRSVWETPHDETAIVSCRFESGTTAEICSSVLFESMPRVEIYGSDGRIFCDDTLGRHGRGRIRINGEEMDFEAENPFRGELRDFVESILDGSEPEVGGWEGLKNILWLSAAFEVDPSLADSGSREQVPNPLSRRNEQP